MWGPQEAISAPTPRILHVYVAALTGLRNMYSPDGLHRNLLSQGRALETAPAWGMVGGKHIPHTGEG